MLPEYIALNNLIETYLNFTIITAIDDIYRRRLEGNGYKLQ